MSVRCPICRVRRQRLYANPEFLCDEYMLPDVCCRCARRAVRRFLNGQVRQLRATRVQQVIA